MIKAVLLHFPQSELSALQACTFKRSKTSYIHAKADIEVFDKAGALVFEGREFGSGMAAYWWPSRVSLIPEWPSA
jgi:hypothetical protein